MAKKTNRKSWLVMAVILLGFGCTIAAGEVIYVDADASPGGDGSSWGTAYKYLQDALDDAQDGNDIWVAAGTYYPDANIANPTGSSDRTATFGLINGVGIYGGYAGFGEPDPNERDVELYETILSGDINTPGDNSDNSYHVVTGSGTDETAVLDGFTITAGNANGGGFDHLGGGMYNYTGSPKVANCTFSSNSADSYAGGMSNENSSPTVTNCTFSGNSASWGGGGMYNLDLSSPTVTKCVFIGNSAGFRGGGMFNTSSSPTVTNCTFSGNSAGNNGGGMFNDNSSPTVTNCILWGNTAPTGPQIFNDFSTPTVTYSDIAGGYAGTGNINADPLFIDPNGLDGIAGTADDEEGYVHLRGYSPCINAGDPGGSYGGQVDIDGQPRVAYGRVDMGADEVFPIAGDFEPDGDVDFYDFGYFANNWLIGK